MKKTIRKALIALATTSMLVPTIANAEYLYPYRIRYDANNDKLINAIDASIVLSEYAATSTNKPSSFTETEKYLVDTNYDGAINAVDASEILSLYAYNATSKEPKFQEIVSYTVQITYKDRFESETFDNYEDCLKWITDKKAENEKRWLTEMREYGYVYSISRYHKTKPIGGGSVEIYKEDDLGKVWTYKP